jgi:hypothetical protein
MQVRTLKCLHRRIPRTRIENPAHLLRTNLQICIRNRYSYEDCLKNASQQIVQKFNKEDKMYDSLIKEILLIYTKASSLGIKKFQVTDYETKSTIHEH